MRTGMVAAVLDGDAAASADARPALNLKQVARRLGVHYMTAYRYVRQGMLPAWREGNVWLVDASDVDAFRADREPARADGDTSTPSTRGGAEAGVDWVGRLRGRLLAGDEVGAWTVVGHALTAGWPPQRCYLELISGSVTSIGSDVASGGLGVADQYLATATAQRLVARLGARFRRRGRARGTVVLGAPRGEHHALPIAVVADLVRLAGFMVLELGADVPADAFVLAAARAERLVAVGIGVTTVSHLEAAAEVVSALHRSLPEVPVLLGGQAVRNPEVAATLGVSEWAADGDAVVAAVERLATGRRRRGPVPAPGDAAG